MLLVDDIYEAAFVPDLWPEVLQKLSDTIGAEGALLANLSATDASWFASGGVQSLYEEFFRNGWAFNNAKTSALLNVEHDGFICDAHHLSDEWMSDQAIYRDLYWRRGFGYAVGTTISVPTGDTLAFSLELKKGRPAATRHELDLLDSLRAHLARSTMLASRLAFAKVEAALTALQMVALPAAMVREDGRVIGCNALFENQAQYVSIRSRDQLKLVGPGAQELFQNSLASFLRSSGQSINSVPSSFPLPAGADDVPAVMHLLPIRGVAQDIFIGTAAFVVITALRSLPGLPANVIQGLFDLTPTEAKIGRRLSMGKTVQLIAQEFQISAETVRSHVKAILSKSGTSRQTDFVAAVASMSSFEQLPSPIME